MKMWIELEIDVNYHHQPHEPQTQTEPEVPAEVEIESVMLGEYDIEFDLSKEQTEQVIAACWDAEAKKSSEDNEHE